jgi:diadenosine tetraphosphatase ApaH/serine/threonine PP2A family protein phosphatase
VRYFVLSDIHANLEAFEAVLAASADLSYDRILVLGDLVGYGADPNAVIDRVRALTPAGIVRGNHDRVACGIEQAEGFNMVARSAALWTFEVLTAERREWLAALPQGPQEVDDLVEICHGSPFDEDAYIFDELDAIRALKASKRPLCLFGHTHSPAVFRQTGNSVEGLAPLPARETSLVLLEGSKYLVNPGSVGQPRDGDPRAAYAIVDTQERHVELIRLKYPIDKAQAKMIKVGLPQVLAQRLAVGR